MFSNPHILAFIGTMSSALAALFAGWQIMQAVRAERRRATFEHLREIDRRLQDVFQINIPAVISEIHEAYRQGSDGLSAEAAKYLAFLNALDLLAREIDEGAVIRRMAKDYLRALCRTELIPVDLIHTIQRTYQNPQIYEHLAKHLGALQRRNANEGSRLDVEATPKHALAGGVASEEDASAAPSAQPPGPPEAGTTSRPAATAD